MQVNHIHRVWPRLLPLLALAFLVSGCAVKRPPIVEFKPSVEASNSLWQTRKSRLALITRWQLKGKLAVRTGKKGGQAKLRWQYTPEEQHIGISGPLGGGRVEVTVSPGLATLKDTKGELFTGRDANSVLQKKLGWPLPFDSLKSWVRGLPASASYQLKLDDQGRVVSLNDGDWQVTYPKYQKIKPWPDSELTEWVPKQIDINALPGRINVYSDTGEYLGDELFVRVVLSSWQSL